MPEFLQEMISVSMGMEVCVSPDAKLPERFDGVWIAFLEEIVEPLWTGAIDGTDMLCAFVRDTPSTAADWPARRQSLVGFLEYMQQMLDFPNSGSDDRRMTRVFAAMGTIRLVLEYAHDFVEGLFRVSERMATSYLREQLLGHEFTSSEARRAALSPWLPEEPREPLCLEPLHFLRMRTREDARDREPPLPGADLCEAFRSVTGGLLQGVLGENLIAAGGAPLSVILGSYMRDVDVFIVGLGDVESAVSAVDSAVKRIDKNARSQKRMTRWFTPMAQRVAICVTPNTLSIFVFDVFVVDGRKRADVHQEIQIVLRLFSDHAQVPLSFDLGPTRVTYDNSAFRTTEFGRISIQNMLCLPDPLRGTSNERYSKYASKGFETALVARDDAQARAFEEEEKIVAVLRTELLNGKCPPCTRVSSVLRHVERSNREFVSPVNDMTVDEQGRVVRIRADPPVESPTWELDSFSGCDVCEVVSNVIQNHISRNEPIPSELPGCKMIRLLDAKNAALGADVTAEISRILEESMADPCARLMSPLQYSSSSLV